MNKHTDDDPLASEPPRDDDVADREAVREKMTDAMTPGFQVEFDPDEAERVGAFVEDALSEEDAAASSDDLMGIGGESGDIARDITTALAREQDALRSAKTGAEAVARKTAPV